MKQKIKINIMLAHVFVHKKYDENSHSITENTDKDKVIIILVLIFFHKIFHVFAGIIRKAHKSIIQKIFILTQIKNDNKTKKDKLYKFVFIHFDFAISSFIMTAKKSFQKKKKRKNVVNKIKVKIIKSTLLIKRILQKSRLFISRLKFHKNHIQNIAQTISLLDSFVMILLFSIKNIKRLAIIHSVNAYI